MTAPNTSLGISVGGDAAQLVIRLDGDLDASSVDGLVSTVAARRPWPELVLDAAGLNFVDSAGLRGLLSIRQMAVEDGTAEPRLSNVGARLRQLLEMCGLADAFEVVD